MSGPLRSPRLSTLARWGTARQPEPQERCELCGEPLPGRHRHMLELPSRELVCACRACSLLFDRPAAGAGRYRLVGDRRLRLDRFELPDPVWDQLRIPVEMAFFFRDSVAGRMVAYYPSPMGPTESRLELEAWEQVARANPVLADLESDVEALLVNRARGERSHWLVPIDDCYRLVAVIRTRWRGFTGGKEVWLEIDRFFAELGASAQPYAERDGPVVSHREGPAEAERDAPARPEEQANAVAAAEGR